MIPLVAIIPTHNRVGLLERTLDSLLACEPREGRPVRAIIVENGGRFGVEALVARKAAWLALEYVYHPVSNKSSALNTVLDGMGDALLLDDDVRLGPDMLVEYSRAAGDRCSGCFYGGSVLVDYEVTPPHWLMEHLPLSVKGCRPDSLDTTSMPYFSSANWAAFSADIREAGGFNPQVGPGGKSMGTGQESAMQERLIPAVLERTYLRDAIVGTTCPSPAPRRRGDSTDASATASPCGSSTKYPTACAPFAAYPCGCCSTARPWPFGHSVLRPGAIRRPASNTGWCSVTNGAGS